MLLQCYATSARGEGTSPETAPIWGRSTVKAPRSACAVAKASAQQLGWRTTTGNAMAKPVRAAWYPQQLTCTVTLMFTPTVTFVLHLSSSYMLEEVRQVNRRLVQLRQALILPLYKHATVQKEWKQADSAAAICAKACFHPHASPLHTQLTHSVCCQSTQV